MLRNVSKTYGKEQVLTGLSLTFPAGQVTCLRGPSGCGKTTLLRLIAGLEKPDGGTIEGVPARIACVFQEDRLCEDFTAVANIRLVTGKRLSRQEIASHLREIGLGENLAKPVREFSGGMKRRVAIARAVCYEGDLLMLDEPFKGLDERLREEVMDYVMRHARGKTVLCVTHDGAEAAYLGGRVIDLELAANTSLAAVGDLQDAGLENAGS